MALYRSFCEGVMNCSQVRGHPDSVCKCNITDDLLLNMEFEECPIVKLEMTKARIEGRQQATIELDRASGQPFKTYIEKNSLVNMLVLVGCKYHEEKKDDHASVVNMILKTTLDGEVMTEVEL